MLAPCQVASSTERAPAADVTQLAAEAHERSASVTDTLVADLDANQLILNRRWDLLVGEADFTVTRQS